MKKLKALFLALASVLCLGLVTACGGGDDKKTETSGSESVSSATDSVTSETVETSTTSEDSTENEDSTTSEDSTGGEQDPVFGEGYETVTVAEALELCGESGNTTTEQYYIIATIDEVTNPQYGAMTVSDETGSIGVYNTKNADGTVGYADMEEPPVKGDKVLLSCILQNYNGTKEIKQAYLIDFEKAVIDDSDYVEMTIADARNAQEGALVKVSGVVAQITYANGFAPNGLILIDETQSIYVFDTGLAGTVAEGNTIEILATKTYWILEKEQSAAAKFGYKGCNQLTDVTLVSNDKGTSEFATEWIEESTVKEIVENPVTNDITSVVYKVNALVKKVEGTGFTNYYFFDIDGETGGYTYTQCNGNDFAWLDEFDGKICTVYLTALNAKSTDSGCLYRLLPISVKYEWYVFDREKDAAQFAVEYYGVDQFESEYTGDPALELNTSVSSELLGFENATLSYASSDTAVVYFETVEGVTVMHCGEAGKATVTVTGTYSVNSIVNSYEATVEITVSVPVTYEYITVAEAIAATLDTEVTVKGIVGPSVVNQEAFYLFGEDGSTITVRTTADTFVGLEIGHEVIVKGTRKTVTKGGAGYFGQTAIDDAELLVNYYGAHEYSTAKFVTDKTPAEFYKLDAKVDYSTTVFVLTATVTVEGNAYYTNLKLTSGDTKISLYCSSANQYGWLQAYTGQEVTMEVAACNWNDKTYWTGCVLAVRNADGTKTYNTLNFDTY